MGARRHRPVGLLHDLCLDHGLPRRHRLRKARRRQHRGRPGRPGMDSRFRRVRRFRLRSSAHLPSAQLGPRPAARRWSPGAVIFTVRALMPSGSNVMTWSLPPFQPRMLALVLAGASWSSQPDRFPSCPHNLQGSRSCSGQAGLRRPSARQPTLAVGFPGRLLPAVRKRAASGPPAGGCACCSYARPVMGCYAAAGGSALCHGCAR